MFFLGSGLKRQKAAIKNEQNTPFLETAAWVKKDLAIDRWTAVAIKAYTTWNTSSISHKDVI